MRQVAMATELGLWVGCCALVTCWPAFGQTNAESARSNDVELVTAETPWRIAVFNGPLLFLKDGVLKVRDNRGAETNYDPAASWSAIAWIPGLAQPTNDWAQPDFKDSSWTRWQDDMYENYGNYGYGMDASGRWGVPAFLCLRTCFGIADPAQTKDVRVTVTCVGGGVVYVNGQEAGRGYLPEGPLAPGTPAKEYAIESYTTDDDTTAVPMVFNPNLPEKKWLDRYKTRARTFSVTIPPRLLVKGRNALAIELRRSPVAGPLHQGGAWSHVGVWGLKVTSASGAGAISYQEAVRGTRVWSAAPTEQVTAETPKKTVLPSNRFWYLYNDAGAPTKGILTANPYDPVLPIKMVAPRNGVCSGQTVLSDPDGVKDVKVAVAEFRGPEGAILPAAAVQVRFAAHHRTVHYCDALSEKAPEGARTVPVWLIVKVPKDQKPGWYASTVLLEANGKKLQVPVQLLVSACEVPDPRDYSSNVAMMQSPQTVALQYKVDMWSDAHFKLLEKSFELLSQVGNDVLYVPVILGGEKGDRAGAVRWVKDGAGYKPEFGAFEKYVDAYAKHCGPPKAIVLYIWCPAIAKVSMVVYEGGARPPTTNAAAKATMVTMVDPATGAMSDLKAPRFDEEGADAFWKPMMDGVREVVLKRGWSERIINVGEGGDLRPSIETGEIFRKWAPYARWDILSHFSGDPGQSYQFYKGTHNEELSKFGRMIASGDFEVGVKEFPAGAPCRVDALEKRLNTRLEFLDLPNYRWQIVHNSPPLQYRTQFQFYEGMARIGLDFWPVGDSSRSLLSGWTSGSRVRAAVDSTTAPGPDGTVPGVRFQMIREAIQDLEVRIGIIRAIAKMPIADQKRYRGLLDELPGRQKDPSFATYTARVYDAAAELAGAKTEAQWDAPPSSERNR